MATQPRSKVGSGNRGKPPKGWGVSTFDRVVFGAVFYVVGMLVLDFGGIIILGLTNRFVWTMLIPPVLGVVLLALTTVALVRMATPTPEDAGTLWEDFKIIGILLLYLVAFSALSGSFLWSLTIIIF